MLRRSLTDVCRLSFAVTTAAFASAHRRLRNFVKTKGGPLVVFLMVALCVAARGGGWAAEPAAPLMLERTIALNGVSGRIDHLAVDLPRKRLFVAELGNGTVDVIDLATGSVIRRIEGLREPQGLAYAPGADILAVASAGDGSVRLFRGADLAPAGMVDLADDADNIRLDTRTGNLVVGYGSGGLATIDPAKASLISRIALPAHPEGFQLDPDNRRAFINVPGARQIAVVDLNAGRQTESWRMPDLRANFPMALDAAQATVAMVSRDPARLVIVDAKTGKPISILMTCGDADDVFFDAKRRRVYVSCGDGNVDAWQQEGNRLRRLSLLKTASGARTSLFVPDLDRLFVAARAGFFGLGSDAAILVLRPTD
jgi:YVTN family beta-propeller protein